MQLKKAKNTFLNSSFSSLLDTFSNTFAAELGIEDKFGSICNRNSLSEYKINVCLVFWSFTWDQTKNLLFRKEFKIVYD